MDDDGGGVVKFCAISMRSSKERDFVSDAGEDDLRAGVLGDGLWADLEVGGGEA